MKCRHGRTGPCPLCKGEAQQRKDIKELKERVETLEREVRRLAKHVPGRYSSDE